jgi:hypothetical protein
MCFFDLANGCFSFRSGRKIFQSHPETVAVTAWPNSAIGSEKNRKEFNSTQMAHTEIQMQETMPFERPG